VEFLLYTLCYAGGCLPLFLYKRLPWRQGGWTLALCPFLFAAIRLLGASDALTGGLFILLLGGWCILFLKHTEPLWILLLWGGCISSVSCASLFCRGIQNELVLFLPTAVALLTGGLLGYLLRWCYRWTIPQELELSHEESVSPAALFAVLEGMSLLLLPLGSLQPVLAGTFLVLCQTIVILLLHLWRDTAVAVVRSQHDSSSQRERVSDIESVDRLTQAKLQQEISRKRILLEEIARAYEDGEEVKLRRLLRDHVSHTEEQIFCDVPLLNTVLCRCCHEAGEKDWHLDIHVEIDALDHLAVPAVGVLLDLMLHLLMLARPVGEEPTLRLRVQECAGILAVTAGCTGRLLNPPLEQWEAIDQMAREQNGWSEWTETAYGLRLNAVLYKKLRIQNDVKR